MDSKNQLGAMGPRVASVVSMRFVCLEPILAPCFTISYVFVTSKIKH